MLARGFIFSAGDGSKGPRLYVWALVELWRLQLSEEEQWWGHYLVRRSSEEPDGRAYQACDTSYLMFTPWAEAALSGLVDIAGIRRHIESCFEEAKGTCGLDEYEARK